MKKNEKKWKKCIKSELLGASLAKIWKIMNEFHVKSSEHGGGLTNFYINFIHDFSYFGDKTAPQVVSTWNFGTAIYDWNMT